MKKHIIYLSHIRCTTKQECLDKVKEIQGSIKKTTLTVEEIIDKTCDGYSMQFAPSHKKWKEQILFGIDIDQLQNISIQRLLSGLQRNKIRPFAIFETLSNENQLLPTRIRLYFLLNRPIQNHNVMRRIITYVCYVVNAYSPGSVDYSCTDPGHLFFPGRLVYKSPGSKIFLKDIYPVANTICADKVILIDRNHLLKQMHTSFYSGYGLPGTLFSDIPDTPSWILLGIYNNDQAEHLTLTFLAPTFSPTLIHVLNTTCNLIHKESIDTLIHNIHIHRGDNRYIINEFFVNSKAQKSPANDFPLVTVNKYDIVYFFSILVHFIADYIHYPDLIYESIKKNTANLTNLSEAFRIKINPVTKEDLIHNLQEYQQLDLVSYPSLSKLLGKKNRLNLLRLILQKAEYNVSMLHYETVSRKCQYAISIQQLQQEAGTSRNNIAALVTLFQDLGLLKRLEEEHINRNLKRKKLYYDLPLTMEIPWYDDILLAKAERKAKQFLEQDKTIRGARKIDMNNDTCLAIKNCVISLLENRGFFTRADLVRLIESEAIVKSGAKGDYLANHYLPPIASSMGLVKQNFTKRLEPLLPDTTGLTYGTSILYFRKELLDDTDCKNTA